MKKDEGGRDTNVQRRIVNLFYNNPDKSYRQKDIIEIKEFKKDTVKKAVKRILKIGIISRFKPHGKNYYRYRLANKEKALRYLEKDWQRGDYPIGSTPTGGKPEDFLTAFIPKEDHHKFHPIRLMEDEWARTEHLYTKPKENDRGKQRQLERKSFTINVSQNTLKGVIWLLKDDWAERLNELYPRVAKQIENRVGFKGSSIDADLWARFRLQAEDLMVVFAKSHYWKELDAEGKETLVNTFLQNIVRTGFEKTTLEAQMVTVMESILMEQKFKNVRDEQVLEELRNMGERQEKQTEANEMMAEILKGMNEGIKSRDDVLSEIAENLRLINEKLFGKDDKEKKEEVPMRDLTDQDLVMFG